MISDLTIVISRKAQLSALRHFCEDLRAERPRLELHCVCPADLVADVQGSVGPEVFVTEWPEGGALDLRRRLHTFLFMMLASEDFSPFFRRRVESAVKSSKPSSFAFRVGRLLTPKLGGPALNRFLARTLSLVYRRETFPTRRVAVLTKCANPHLLCNRRHEVVSILDGWDHPTTSPAGYWTRAIAAWNDDLADDWVRNQGAGTVISGYPYRFAYVLRRDRTGLAPAPRRPGVRLLYAMATFPSRSPLDQRRHEEETAVVRCLHAWLRPQAGSFEVKPHPIGPTGHLDRLLEECPGLVVHPYEESGGASYDLTDGYNRKRLKTLGAADLVLGIWTTFLLDAAIAGKAIALVHLPDDSSYEALLTAQLGLHVHHLRERVSAVIGLRPEGPSFSGDATEFGAFVDEAARSGRRVADWLVPDAAPRRLPRAVLADVL